MAYAACSLNAHSGRVQAVPLRREFPPQPWTEHTDQEALRAIIDDQKVADLYVAWRTSGLPPVGPPAAHAAIKEPLPHQYKNLRSPLTGQSLAQRTIELEPPGFRSPSGEALPRALRRSEKSPSPEFSPGSDPIGSRRARSRPGSGAARRHRHEPRSGAQGLAFCSDPTAPPNG